MKIRDENGGILPLTAGFVFVAVLLLAVVVDFGRYTVSKEKLQTAGDAASLAGAKSVERMVRLEIDPGDAWSLCCGVDDCYACCIDCGSDPVFVTGKEVDLLENGGWRNYCCDCGCGEMKILDRWVNYTNGGADALRAARAVFALNRPAEMELEKGGEVSLSVDISNLSESRRSNPLYPSVLVRTQGKIKTLMISFFNNFAPGLDASEMNLETCSQGRTYYRDVSNGKWRHPPNNQCPE